MKRFIALTAAILLTFPLTAEAYSDLPSSHHHYFSMTYLSAEGLIGGYSDGTVRADNLINRAELIKILVESLDETTDDFGLTYADTYNECFEDVINEWFAPYICFAAEEGWVDGYPDGLFRPEQEINKVEAAKIIINAFEIPLSNSTQDLYLDTDESDWYGPFLQTAVDKNLLEESSGTYFSPTNSRSRGEVSQMIARIMQINYMNDTRYSEWIGAEFQTFFLINDLRAANGVSEKLILNPLLTKVAREHAQDMAEVIGGMSHEGSNGSQSYDRIRESGIEGNSGTGENVGTGVVGGSRTIFQAITDVHNNIFMPEPDGECNHRTTILSTCLPFKEVGIGVYVKDSQMYFTEDFVYFVE